jgi:hypothetical protein
LRGTGTEYRLTKAITLIALACLLVVGAAAVSILGRDSVPAVHLAIAAPAIKSPAANREGKADRLAVVSLAAASLEPPPATFSEPLRQAFASTAPTEIEALRAASPPAEPAPPAPPKPKTVSKPPLQKSYALLSDIQIAGIKERLRLSAVQESYWPPVETALRAIARRIHASQKVSPNAGGAPPIDPDSEEVQQLKSAAMPLLFQLREDQKNEVRALARIIGLEKVAAQI